jgi:hypothetical protein
MAFRTDDDNDDLFDEVSRMADRMGLKGEKRAVYIDDHMTQGGYGRVQSRESYQKIRQEGDEDQDGGNRWGFGRGGGGGNGGGRSGRNRDDDDSF